MHCGKSNDKSRPAMAKLLASTLVTKRQASRKPLNRAAHAIERTYLVRLDGESSNRLFETLEQWNTYLKANAPTYQEPQP